MKTSDYGVKLIADREGVRLDAYQDSAGIWTIGVGHTAAAGQPHPARGMRITERECYDILANDLDDVERAVTEAVDVPLSQNEFDALVSLVFNIGAGAFRRSTVLRRLNAGDRKGAADAFLMWKRAGGRVVQGLVNRRRAEREQFMKRD